MAKRILIAGIVLCVVLGGVVAQEDGAPQGQGAEPTTVLAVEEEADLGGPLESDGDPSVLELLRRGGPLMYPLYLLSFVMIAFGIERAVSLQRARVLPRGVVSRIREVTEQRHGPMDVERLLADISNSESPIVRVVRAGLRKAYRPTAEIEKAIEDAGAREAAALRRNCKVLSVTASVSPLLGLLGTVLGMIKAFMTVASREEALGRTELLASGIYQALMTTAAGLCVAIQALILYHLFVDKVERLVTEMDDISVDLVERMSLPGEITREG